MTYSQPSKQPIHIRKSEILRRLRISAGYSQTELARQLKAGRHTVWAIETCRENTMRAMHQDLFESWFGLCFPDAGYSVQKEARDTIMQLYELD